MATRRGSSIAGSAGLLGVTLGVLLILPARARSAHTTAAPTQSDASPCGVTGSYAVSDPFARLCDPITATLVVTPTCPRRPLHVVFAIDEPSPVFCFRAQYLSSAQRAVDAFDKLDVPIRAALVVGRQERADIEVDMTDNINDVARGLNSIRIQHFVANTLSEDSMLEAALDMLEEERAGGGAAEAIVVLSDSIPWAESNPPVPWMERRRSRILGLARRARADGIDVVASCHDTDDPQCQWAAGPNHCDEVDHRLMASRPALYVYAGDGVGSYGGVAELIARGMSDLVVTELVVTDTLRPSLELVAGTMRPPGEYDPVTRSFTWTMSVTDTGPHTLTFAARSVEAFSGSLSSGARARLVDSEGRVGSGLIASPALTVTRPCPTPTPTRLPTATSTSTAQPTATPIPTSTPAPSAAHLPAVVRSACKPSRHHVDVVLALDASTSMLELAGGGTKLDVAADAVRNFLDHMRLGDGDRAALITFNAGATVAQPLTSDRVALDTALDGIVAAPETCLVCAIDVAAQTLADVVATTRVLIVLTDGRSNPRPAAEAVAAAADAKARGIAIFTVGIGGELDFDALRAIASQPGYFYRSHDAEDLQAIYASIARAIPCP